MKRLLGILVAATVATASHAVVYGFAAPLINGSQQVPPNASTAFGTASFTVDTATWEVAGAITTFGLSSTEVTGAHIHKAPVGVNGPVFFDIASNLVGGPITSGSTVFWLFKGTLTDTSKLADMVAGNTYINIHTSKFPGGAIRGQVDCYAVPEPSSLIALGLAGGIAVARRRRK